MNKLKLSYREKIITCVRVVFFFHLFIINAYAQKITVSGVVLDNQGETLPGVSVKVKNATQGTITDSDGKYSIVVPAPSSILVFTYLGFTSQEVAVNNRTKININLKPSTSSLEEVVVVGYGTLKRKDVTGSVASVNIADFEKAPITSFDQALAGRIAGVQVSGNDGQPGSVNNIIIRGAGSITQDNSPLYVVDGFPLEDANNNAINPADIESIEVLKDASATAIYGARGSNGVIMITTKKGKVGDPVIGINSYYGFQEVIRTMKLMNAYEFVSYQNDLNPSATAATYFTGGKNLESYRNAPTLNLQQSLYRNSPMQNYDLSVRGGTEKTKYSISGNIIDQEGIIINSGFKRYQGRLSLDQTINKKLKVGTNINISNSVNNGTIVAQSNFSATLSLMSSVWGYRPITNSNVDLLDEPYDPEIDPLLAGDYRFNPILSAKNELRELINNNLNVNAYAQYEITPHLTLRITGGITKIGQENNQFNNSRTSLGNPRNINGVFGSINNNLSNTWLNENTLTYNKSFNKKHNLNAVIGFSSQQNNSKFYGFQSITVPNEDAGLDGLDEAPFGSTTPTSRSSRWTLASFLGRINYNINYKYLFTASLRSDGSSKFLGNNQWSYFPSGSFAWRFNKEKFMKNIKVIDDAKLRMSYGLTGNNRVTDFAGYSQLAYLINSGYTFNNSSVLGATFTAYGNRSLKWETTAQANIGLDLAMFKQRLLFTADVYRKTTKDLLLRADIPATTGLTNAFKNIGKVENSGLELSLTSTNIKSKNFSWVSNFNISFNRNKILQLTEGQDALLSSVSFDILYNNNPTYIAQIGQPIAQMFGLIWDGVYQYEDFDITPSGGYTLKSNLPDNGGTRGGVAPGSIKYKDINLDGTINSKDFAIIGRATPIHVGGFSNNFTYKGFDLNVFFQWSYGNDILNANRLIFEGNGNNRINLNQFASFNNRWTPTNPSNTLFRAGGQGPAFYSSRVIEDGSFLRLKTVSFGYNLSNSLLKQFKLKGLRVYASAQNLYTWTNYTGSDPDVSARNSNLTPGFDFSSYPQARTLIFGLNVSL
ncbi:SusC/RagA family TonB-linked outer membrane protein [Pedobacter puniceum]|uniref:SusC/RagA family TonB-linked outer membrane protein n=1 Tax=Pedobacter puniceum TaxID=2666136 RepID=A0A7K0FIM6_9SPHI|nr:TonB-dependent receptor [Pedobacter puniceum]MRX45758.1 SusC/RagA family TonB-linked outer membrane protein [Pedobacter puniceum]